MKTKIMGIVAGLLLLGSLSAGVVVGSTTTKSYEREACTYTNRIIFGSSSKYVSSTSPLRTIETNLNKFVPKITGSLYTTYGDPAVLLATNNVVDEYDEFKQALYDLRAEVCF